MKCNIEAIRGLKSPEYMAQINELNAGDIIIFRAPKRPNIVGYGIMFMQSLIGQTHGHYDSTHAGICTGKNEQGEPIIAHLTGHQIMAYKQEPLVDVINRDGGDRAFIVYRPTNETAAAAISQVAADESTNSTIKWSRITALGAFAHSAALDACRQLSEKKFSKNSICSKFVIQAIKIATQPSMTTPHDVSLNYYPNIRSSSTPKTLEANLFNNPNYRMLVHPGKTNPYSLIKGEIQTQLERISKRTDAASKAKYVGMLTEFERITTKLDDNDQLNDLQRAIRLLNELSPALRKNTGYNLREAESYRAVISKARSIGIFERDIQAAPFQ